VVSGCTPSCPVVTDFAWSSSALKGALVHWDNYEPHMFLECDKILLAELPNCNGDNEFWDEYVIRFLQRRSRPSKRVSIAISSLNGY
jgi:hypothetical protein